MKLMLFTPVVKSSAIGRMACLITQKLIAYGHEIVVVRTEEECFFNQPIHNFGTELVSWCEFERVNTLAQSADALIYQIGDNYGFHQGCIVWLEQLSGIVCLHDFFLGNLFHRWAQAHRPEADAILRNWYTPEVADQFFSYKNGESFIEGMHATSPMTEWICSMAQSTITHSDWGIERVLNSCAGQVRVVPLAYESKLIKNNVSTAKNDKLRILTVGHINKNKRAANVIRAIGKNRLLCKKVIYQLIGYITPETRAELSTLAKKQKVNLIISGEVDDAILIDALDQANVISCLRWPALEAASVSAIEALWYGKPTMVTSTGFYSQIPDECAIKINPENEISEIKTVLEKLQANPQHLKELGQCGQQWAMQTFTADNYALKLIEVVLVTIRTGITANSLNYFSKLMHAWGGNNELIDQKYLIEPLAIFDVETTPPKKTQPIS
jgi:glycosyltransferase involved in cell wall biosynthesis